MLLNKKLIWISLFMLSLGQAAFAQKSLENLKIAVVNMNQAINESESGKRSKKLLESKFKEYESSLKTYQDRIVKLQGEIKNSLLLTADAKQKKEGDLRNAQVEFQRKRNEITNNLRKDEARHTQNLYEDIRSVIASTVGKKYDLVIEANMMPMLLYTKTKITDITKEVILEFNKAQK